MAEYKSASKETIANLIDNSGLAIDSLYKDLKRELIVRSLMDKSTPALYVLTQDLRNGIKFILMDVASSSRAELSVDNSYEKRFHLKNIQASISEGYKLLFSFGKLRNKSLWRNLMKQINKEGTQELISEGIVLDKRLKVFGDTEIDKELRDLTFHYDDEMIKVYKKTVSVNSEEDVMKKVCGFWCILLDLQLYTDKVDEYCYSKNGISKPSPSSPIQLNVNTLHMTVCQLINKNRKLENVFDNWPKGTIESIDSMAEHWNATKRVETFISNELPSIGVVPEIVNLRVLINIQFLLRFMMLDMSAILNAYLKSASDIEYALNLRRICIIKVATMVHLYGYTPEEKDKSIWKVIEDIVPKESSELIIQSKNICDFLKYIVSRSHDKNLRATFVHSFDNSKACSNLSDIISAIEEINPIVQVVEIQLLLEVYKLIMHFSTNLMYVLAQEAKQKRVRGKEAINEQMNEIIRKIEDSKLLDDQKRILINMIKDTKRKMNHLLKL